MVNDPYCSSTDNSANLTEEDTQSAVRDPRRKKDDLPDDGETAESSHHWTDGLESEILGESDVLSDVEEILTATTVSLTAKGWNRHVPCAVAEMDRICLKITIVMICW